MYHISKRGKRTHPRLWIPRLPTICEYDGRLHRETPRICLAPTIDQCLMSVGIWSAKGVKRVEEYTPGLVVYNDEKYTVWSPCGSPWYFCPSQHEVHDVWETDEHWLLQPWPMRYVGTIQVAWNNKTSGNPLEWKWVHRTPPTRRPT